MDLLAQVQIRDPARVAGSYPHELSGGMGQRVMIAMMLAPDPELLIADEPTSALDATVQAEILRLMEDLVARRGMGLMLISHDLPLVSHFCDRVAVMYAGRIVEELAAADLGRATHPYTRGLLGCLPTLTHPKPRLPVMARDPAWLRETLWQVETSRHIAWTLRVRFGPVEAVRGVSFAVPEGGAFGIVGESGSGKSTVLRALAGLNATGPGAWRSAACRWRRGGARTSSAACRWCSRTRTARCTRARPWTGR